MLKPLRIFLPAGLSLLLILPSGAALAQSNDVRGLADTVSRLERQLQALERNVYRGAPPPATTSQPSAPGASVSAAPSGTALSNIQVTTDGLEEQLRRLTGQVEQLDFQVRQINQRMDRLVSDVDFRLQALEQGTGSATAPGSTQPTAPSVPRAPGAVTIDPAGSPGSPRVFGTLTESQLQAAGVETTTGAGQTAAVDPTVQAPPSTALPAGSPRDQYDFAYQFLLQRDFESAETALSAFVAANPEDALAGNAQYWLGETFYVRGDYPTAARAFAEGFQRYPDSTKAPDNLLKLGMSLAQLDQSADACITLKKLRVEYPDAPTSIVQRADREIGRLQCP
ncbi:MAG: tol-pal system protein YbgF [Proteobacteria bacterium]|nr:tol-pal system protein YbgF [Pseudomonadota bacterium]